MPLLQTLLQDAQTAGDAQLVPRLICALGPLGFYYPEPILELLRPLAARTDHEPIDKALVTCLATMRTVHFDDVDLFVHQVGLSESFRRRLDAAWDVDLVRRYIHMIGYYNNSVHFSLHYPKMRRQLSTGALKLLTQAPDAERFVADYAAVAVRMFRDADFQLREWTTPE
jgi:hypothetical protein